MCGGYDVCNGCAVCGASQLLVLHYPEGVGVCDGTGTTALEYAGNNDHPAYLLLSMTTPPACTA